MPDLPTTRPAPSTNAMPASRPVSITIPAIDVHSQVVPIGTTADGTLAVPQPGPDLNKVAWYEDSPTPGQVGPAVLEGHVDTTQGASVFFRLGALRPGNTISITRADHTTATFTVDAVRSYPSHAAFPRAEVFGGDVTQPVLRLITCADFDHHTGHYVGNLVVFAHLTST